MTPKQQAFQDMRDSGLDTKVFDFEVLLLGFRIDGRMTNGTKKGTKRKPKITIQKHNTNPVKPFKLIELEGGFVIRID